MQEDDLVLGNIDSDGDLDLVFANTFNEPNGIWMNDGQRKFSKFQSVGAGFTRGIELGDLDGDGNTCIVFANFCVQPNSVWFANSRR